VIRFTITVEAIEDGMRLDKWFQKRYPKISRDHLHKLFRTGQVRLDKKRVKSSCRLQKGQQIRVPPKVQEFHQGYEQRQAIKPLPSTSWALTIKNKILKMDRHIIAINKPAGLAVQGGSQQSLHLDGMLDALRFGAKERPRLVHRLDKDTSGVLLIARSAKSARALTEAFKNKTVQKNYWAIVVGKPEKQSGLINKSLYKAKGRWGEKIILDNVRGKNAETYFRVIVADNVATLLELSPITGRTHQLRAHCSISGFPILGDGKYGGKNAFVEELKHSKKLHLYSREIKISHPQIGMFTCQAPIPTHMARTLSLLRFQVKGMDCND